MPEYTEIIIRTLIAFILLWTFVHILGKQTIFQKTYHLYIASITMGTLAGNLAFNIKIKFGYFILSFFILGTVILILNKMAVGNIRYRKWIVGKPIILIEKGHILESTMLAGGFTLEDLKQSLRKKGIFNIDEVAFAILEVDGTLSVQKKAEYQAITKQDLHINVPPTTTAIELIYNACILSNNLLKHGYSEEWLNTELNKRKLKVEDISYAVIGTHGNLYIDLFRDHISN
ncbi:DUF421 domain-containing protein [Neobacillus terrae]|uniref:DUF421 domain-containing protein n=1 Tax=Neobacillus terrae TaxID=3034837 RepID=UPI001409E776|nr:DUF421 domain-containing protein [Neobacillus terrae]NHM32113.1 DUF421 domain-containing protein [Neobacillus terrae]